MARKTKKQKEKEKRLLIGAAVGALLIVFGYLLADAVGRTTGSRIVPPIEELLGMLEAQNQPIVQLSDGTVLITAIDVGQGDCTLIQNGNQTILIDAGENDKGGVVLDALKSYGVTRLDYVIGTHPHSDHIGGLDSVIDALPVGEVILPIVPEAMTPTTKTYLDLLESIDRAGCALTAAEPERKIRLDGGAVLTLLGPPTDGEYKDLNNYSVVARLDYSSTSFLFCGDCSTAEEKDLLAASAHLEADVLFTGHHGSNSSTSKAYLAAVNPKVARISCGANNDYGHPHAEVVERLSAVCPIYRTDLLGDLVFRTDGLSLTVHWQDGNAIIY